MSLLLTKKRVYVNLRIMLDIGAQTLYYVVTQDTSVGTVRLREAGLSFRSKS